MITIRNGTAAFLKNSGRYLLMKRAADRKIAPRSLERHRRAYGSTGNQQSSSGMLQGD